MVAVILVLAACAVSGSDQTGNQSNVVADLIASREKQMGSDPCWRRDGASWRHVGWRNCLLFPPPQRMRGVWVQDFEESSFIPRTQTIPAPDNRVRFRVYLEVDPKAVERLTQTLMDMKQPRAVALEFIGRRSKEAGEYYTGSDDYVVLVDRLISARYLGRAPVPDFVPASKEVER